MYNMAAIKFVLLGFCAFWLTESLQAACRNLHPKCDSWASQGFCTGRYEVYMRIKCPKSCNICSDNCGRPEVQQSRVISGTNATKGAWPWQTLMTLFRKPMCGGSIVAPNWIVTAAHCVYGYKNFVKYFRVRVGEHITSTSSDGQHQDVEVEKIIMHPSYSPRLKNYDIALMKLKTPVQFGKYVKPVCLPDQGQNVPVGTQCYITGWGRIKYPGSMHHTLQQGKMPVVSKQTCANMNEKNLGIAITDQMVCAGHGGTTRVSGCHGDSGGPFVCQTGADGRWVLHGAVSWGSGRCDATKGYSVFARVAVFKNWLDQTMENN